MNETGQLFPDREINTSTQQMLQLLADIGTSKELISVLLEFSEVKLTKDQKRFLCGPMIQHKSARQETTPDWMYKAITADRLNILFAEMKDEAKSWEVGPIELMTVMYPATMDAPLRYELAQLYFWAGSYAHEFHRKQSREEFRKMIGSDPIEDEQVKTPGGNLYHHYQNLCSSIRSKVIKAQREREVKRPNKNEQKAIPTNKKASPENNVIQMELF